MKTITHKLSEENPRIVVLTPAGHISITLDKWGKLNLERIHVASIARNPDWHIPHYTHGESEHEDDDTPTLFHSFSLICDPLENEELE